MTMRVASILLLCALAANGLLLGASGQETDVPASRAKAAWSPGALPVPDDALPTLGPGGPPRPDQGTGIWCSPRQNPHRYVASYAAGRGATGAVDASSPTCEREDVPTPFGPIGGLPRPDGEPEHGAAGGFFPADHHGSTFRVEDRVGGGTVLFTVGSDTGGTGLVDCEQPFEGEGTTACPPGGDGGWWVFVQGVVDPVHPVRVVQPSVAGNIFTTAAAASSPQRPILLATPGDGEIHLRWVASNAEVNPIAKFILYRSTTPGNEVPYKTIPVSGSAPTSSGSYVDTDVVNGQPYYYKILAEDAAQEQSALSEEVGAKPGAGQNPLAYGGAVTIYWVDGQGDQARWEAPGWSCAWDSIYQYVSDDDKKLRLLCEPLAGNDWSCMNPFVLAAMDTDAGGRIVATNDCATIVTTCETSAMLDPCAGTVAPNWGVQKGPAKIDCQVEIDMANVEGHLHSLSVQCYNDP